MAFFILSDTAADGTGVPITLTDQFSSDNVVFVTCEILDSQAQPNSNGDLHAWLNLRLKVDSILYSAADLEPIIESKLFLYGQMKRDDDFRVGDGLAVITSQYGDNRYCNSVFFVTQGGRLIPAEYDWLYTSFAGMTVAESTTH